MTLIIIALAIVFIVSAVLFAVPARNPVAAAVYVNRSYAATSYHCHACNCRHTEECRNKW